MLAGVSAVGLVGIENRESMRQAHRGFGEVMIGDDQVEVEPCGFVGGGEGADAGVDADDESHTITCSMREHLRLHAVAVAQAMRDVEADGATENLDSGLEQNDGGSAVDVVVAVDEDRFTRGDGLLDTFDRDSHPVERIWIEQVVQRGMEELRGGSGIHDTALQ